MVNSHVKQNGPFDAELVSTINRAYKSTIELLDLSRNQHELRLSRVKVADLIVTAARAGERCEKRLKQRAVAALLSASTFSDIDADRHL